jgi:hypothetical protein
MTQQKPLRSLTELKRGMDALKILRDLNYRVSMPDEISEGCVGHLIGAVPVAGNGDLIKQEVVYEVKSSMSSNDGPSTLSPNFDFNCTLLFVQFNPSLDGLFDVWEIPTSYISKDKVNGKGSRREKINFKKIIRDNKIEPIYRQVTIFKNN